MPSSTAKGDRRDEHFDCLQVALRLDKNMKTPCLELVFMGHGGGKPVGYLLIEVADPNLQEQAANSSVMARRIFKLEHAQACRSLQSPVRLVAQYSCSFAEVSKPRSVEPHGRGVSGAWRPGGLLLKDFP